MTEKRYTVYNEYVYICETKDIEYSYLLKDKRGYELMVLHDVQDQSFQELAEKYGISISTVRNQYNRTRDRQKKLYIRHIATALGHEEVDLLEEEAARVEHFYRNVLYTCGYLEMKYKEILTKYRKGEPGLPDKLLRGMPAFRSFEPSKEEVQMIVQMKEEDRASFKAIGRRFGITKEKALYIYDYYYHEKLMEIYLEELKNASSKEEEWKIKCRFFGNGIRSARVRYNSIKES